MFSITHLKMVNLTNMVMCFTSVVLTYVTFAHVKIFSYHMRKRQVNPYFSSWSLEKYTSDFIFSISSLCKCNKWPMCRKSQEENFYFFIYSYWQHDFNSQPQGRKKRKSQMDFFFITKVWGNFDFQATFTTTSR